MLQCNIDMAAMRCRCLQRGCRFTCMPISTTRPGGMRKQSVASEAFPALVPALALASFLADSLQDFAAVMEIALLNAFTAILVCQLAGEFFVSALGLPFPGPVAGMALLFGILLAKGSVPEELGKTGDALLQNLSLLFVPAGVGIMAHFDLLSEEWPALALALAVSTLATIAVTAGLMNLLARPPQDEPNEGGDAR